MRLKYMTLFLVGVAGMLVGMFLPGLTDVERTLILIIGTGLALLCLLVMTLGTRRRARPSQSSAHRPRRRSGWTSGGDYYSDSGSGDGGGGDGGGGGGGD